MRNWLAALLAAALLWIATPPHTAWPVMFVALVPLLLAIEGQPPRRAFLLGWVTGGVYYLLSCPWWYTLPVRAFAAPPPLALLVYLVMNLWSGLPYGVATWATGLLTGRFRLHPAFVAPLAFAAAEAAIPAFFKGYLGMTVWRVWPLLQFAEVGGPAAVTAVLVLANAVVAAGVAAVRRGRAALRPALVSALVLAVLLGLGALRGYQVAALRDQAATHPVGIVHVESAVHATEQQEGWALALLRALGRESVVLLARGAELVIWPEAIWPGTLARPEPGDPGPEFLQTLLLGFDGRLLFGTGTLDAEGALRNSAVLLSSRGQVEAMGDKTHLVPLYEGAPLGDVLPGWRERLAELLRRPRPYLHAAEKPAVIESGPLRFGIFFCSEEMLVGYGQQMARRGPNVLLGLVNDYWSRGTGAIDQHISLAVFRAVEARRDLVRVTDSGISAHIDAAGRVRALIPQGSGKGPVVGMMLEVAPLELPASGPYVIPFFLPGCVATLALAAWLSRRAEGLRPAAGAASPPGETASVEVGG